MIKNRLESVMKLNGENGGDLTKALGISRSTFSLKLNEKNGSSFTLDEIIKIGKHYNLSKEDLADIFLTKSV